MISYVTLGVSDIAAARKFYGDLLGELGAKTLLNMDRITFFGKGVTAANKPFDRFKVEQYESKEEFVREHSPVKQDTKNESDPDAALLEGAKKNKKK